MQMIFMSIKYQIFVRHIIILKLIALNIKIYTYKNKKIADRGLKKSNVSFLC